MTKKRIERFGKPLSIFVQGASESAIFLLKGFEDGLALYRQNKIVRKLPDIDDTGTRKSEIRKKKSLKRKRLIQVPWHIFD